MLHCIKIPFCSQKTVKVEPVGNHVSPNVVNMSKVPEQTSVPENVPREITANHMGSPVNGHGESPAVNGEHPNLNGEGEPNGEMEVRLILISFYFFFLFPVSLCCLLMLI